MSLGGRINIESSKRHSGSHTCAFMEYLDFLSNQASPCQAGRSNKGNVVPSPVSIPPLQPGHIADFTHCEDRAISYEEGGPNTSSCSCRMATMERTIQFSMVPVETPAQSARLSGPE